MGFDTTTLVLLLILGAITILIGWKRPFEVLAALVLILPFRDFSIRVLNAFTDISIQTVNSLSRWWFVVILGILVVWALRGGQTILRTRKLPNMSWVDVILGAILLLGIGESFFSPIRSAGITSLRGYLQPLAVFVLARAFPPKTQTQLRNVNAGFLIVGALLFSVALWQVLGWSEETYTLWGYLTQEGKITGLPLWLGGDLYIRPASTVSGPNELGVLFSIFFFLALSWAVSGSSKVRPFMILLSIAFLTGLAMTFSRSAFLGFVIAAFVFLIHIILRSKEKLASLEQKQRWMIFLASASAIVAIILVLGLVGMYGYVGRTLAALSEEPHIQESLAALRYIPAHPAGVGMGMVSPKGALALMQVESRFHVEGSLFQIALEWGLWGFALWMAFIGLNMWKIWEGWGSAKDVETHVLVGAAFTAWVTSLVAFVFLPLMQSVNLMVLLWFLLGSGSNNISFKR
jgi:hypothetical protein